MADPTSQFTCLSCRGQVWLADHAEPHEIVGCPDCETPLGLFADLDRRRADRRFILTGGRPQPWNEDEV